MLSKACLDHSGQVLGCAEQGFSVGVVIAHSQAAVGRHHAQGLHGTPLSECNTQGVLCCLFAQAPLAQQLTGMLRGFDLKHVFNDKLSAVDVLDHVSVNKRPLTVLGNQVMSQHQTWQPPAPPDVRLRCVCWPTLHGAYAHSQFTAGARLACSCLYGFIDQLHNLTAIVGVDQASSLQTASSVYRTCFIFTAWSRLCFAVEIRGDNYLTYRSYKFNT